eukprot:scaffold25980_cov69-Phaeocystis_antarctica.AAC.1
MRSQRRRRRRWQRPPTRAPTSPRPSRSPTAARPRYGHAALPLVARTPLDRGRHRGARGPDVWCPGQGAAPPAGDSGRWREIGTLRTRYLLLTTHSLLLTSYSLLLATGADPAAGDRRSPPRRPPRRLLPREAPVRRHLPRARGAAALRGPPLGASAGGACARPRGLCQRRGAPARGHRCRCAERPRQPRGGHQPRRPRGGGPLLRLPAADGRVRPAHARPQPARLLRRGRELPHLARPAAAHARLHAAGAHYLLALCNLLLTTHDLLLTAYCSRLATYHLPRLTTHHVLQARDDVERGMLALCVKGSPRTSVLLGKRDRLLAHRQMLGLLKERPVILALTGQRSGGVMLEKPLFTLCTSNLSLVPVERWASLP